MSRQQQKRIDRQRGLSLSEVLVAISILALAMTSSLVLYDGARRSLKLGENIMDQQQVVRIAYDMISSDLRMAGFNYNPDGATDRPDEAIEAAFDTAVVMRADFDYEDSTDASDPEELLAGVGGAFSSVTTGNDEIVAYVLKKDDGSGGSPLSFYADVAETPRDGDVEEVQIDGVALTQDDPPYTLYRVTLDNADGTISHAIPLAGNIRSMRFRYFDQAGQEIGAVGGGDTEAARIDRARIRRVALDIEGLTKDGDLRWIDPDDTDVDTRSHRKFGLSGEVTPRNLGLRGLRDINASLGPPAMPAMPSLAPGHCKGLFVNWDANPPQDEIDYYRVAVGPAPGPTDYSAPTGSNSIYLDDLEDATGYYVRVQAINSAGDVSAPSLDNWAETLEDTQPASPPNFDASVDIDGRILLDWDSVTQNVAGATLDPGRPVIRDFEAYEIYRSEDPGTLDTDGAPYATMYESTFTDTSVVGCRNYYYLVAAVDGCDGSIGETSTATGSAGATDVPSAPNNVGVTVSPLGDILVTWDEVTLAMDGGPLWVDTYRIYQMFRDEGSPPPDANDGAFLLVGEVTIDPGDPVEFVHTGGTPPGSKSYYYVSAVDGCDRESDGSVVAELQGCTFSGNVDIILPLAGAALTQPVVVDAQVLGGSDTYESFRFEFIDLSNGSNVTTPVTCTEQGDVCTTWLPPRVRIDHFITGYDTPMTIRVTVTNAAGCSRTTSTTANTN